MKKNRLNLSNLKVTSFVTDLEAQNKETVKGGVNIYTNLFMACSTFHNCQTILEGCTTQEANCNRDSFENTCTFQ